ncbi:MAG: FtsQ-type POTRA domain-containing protein [Candidatus Gastranaerophilaceae bacterium]
MTENENEEKEQRLSRYAAERRIQKNQMERKVRRSQMWLRRFRIFSRLSIILLLIVFGYLLAKSHQWYLNKNVFNSLSNPSLEILNNKIVPSYKILAALRRTEVPNKPIYRLETDEIKHNIMQLEPIEDVFIRRFWFPARLQVIVQERVPIITISPAENVPPIAFFARGGKLIGRDYMPLDKSFKTILVLSYGTRGDDYRNWNNEKIKLIEKIAKAVNASADEEVEYIDFRTPKDVYVKVKTANIRLGEIDDTVFERIKRIPSILPQVKMLDKKIKYVDLRWKDANYIKLD